MSTELDATDFRNHLYDPLGEKLSPYRGMRYDDFAEKKRALQRVQDVLPTWLTLYEEPYVGITSDGSPVAGLYALDPVDEEHLAPESAMREAATQFLGTLSPAEVARVRYPLDAHEWRAWSNPEFVIHDVGVRLENLSESSIVAFLGLLRASLSESGYDQVTRLMQLNKFLGELVELREVLNEHSYQVSIFGIPDADEPWGWQMFGHHIALNVVVIEGRLVIAPVFLGAEPNTLPEMDWTAFEERRSLALRLRRSLDSDQATHAVLYTSVQDPAMPEGRLHPMDERILAGAFRDNRTIPYEGVQAGQLRPEQVTLLLEIIADSLSLLPHGSAELKLAEVEEHLADTFFAWIGGSGETDPFYFRVQSPVLLTEFDNKSGVWLNNAQPAPFHTHTTLRFPNGNDYGKAYIGKLRAR